MADARPSAPVMAATELISDSGAVGLCYVRQLRCRLLAHLGHGAMSDLSPLCGQYRTSLFHLVRMAACGAKRPFIPIQDIGVDNE